MAARAEDSALTEYCTGMETQMRCVTVTVHDVPASSVWHVTAGVPWQVVVTVPTETDGVSVTGALISTHCIPSLLQPEAEQAAWPESVRF